MDMMLSPLRILLALSLVLLWLGLCLHAWRKAARARAGGVVHNSAPNSANRVAAVDWYLLYASQSGNARELAQQTALLLRAAGQQVQVLNVADCQPAEVARWPRQLWFVATYGEGDAPDDGARFALELARSKPDLRATSFAMLALGDAGYRHFCGFARRLEACLRECGAAQLSPRVDVDQMSGTDLGRWWQGLQQLQTGLDLQAAQQQDDDWRRWELTARHCLNPGSSAAPVFHLEFSCGDADLPQWQAGDLARIRLPHAPQQVRDYSIASIYADGRLHLLVRLRRRADGQPGLVSGWLQQAALGSVLEIKVRAHEGFRAGANAARRMILIGNGTGIAGLRSHLRARAAQLAAAPGWLIFGERDPAHDCHYQHELQAWHQSGVLQNLDLSFSREASPLPWVQHRLLAQRERLVAWVEQGAAIYVCGSLHGMAQAVDASLRQILGEALLQQLQSEGRYRRDVY